MAGFSFAAWGNDLYTGRRSYPIISKRRRWFGVFALLAVASIAVLGVRGLSLSIDFRGGTEITLANTSTTDQQPAIAAVQAVVPGEQPLVASVGSNGVRIQTNTLSASRRTRSPRRRSPRWARSSPTRTTSTRRTT